MKEIRIKVKGMVCEGCENRVKNALSVIEGIEKVKASHQTGMVTIEAKEEIEKTSIEERIDDLGFEVEG